MNLDRFCFFLFALHLPILFLPKAWLASGVALGGAVLLLGIGQRKGLICLLGMILCVNYLHVQQIAKKAENLTAYSNTFEEVEIVKILKHTDYQTAVGTIANGEQIYLNWQADTPLQLHHRYRIALNLRPISARYNIGNFDRQKWLFANHINAIATVKKAELLSVNRLPFRTLWLENVRQETNGLPIQGLILALAFGERAWLSTAHWAQFQQTATAHLIAISGLHIALAMAFGVYLAKGVQWLCLRSRVKALQAVGFSLFFANGVGFAFALGYSYLAGFAVPTLRALFAIAFVLACRWARRHYTPWQCWWRVVALLVAPDPLTLLSDSFWLSTLAVASLILWYDLFPLRRMLGEERDKKLPAFHRLWLSLLHLQIGIWLVFSPVQLYFFEGTSPFALPANLLIVPLYSVVLVPLILFSLLTHNLFSTWQWADYIAQGSLRLLEPMSDSWLALSQTQQWGVLSVNLLILWLIYCKTHQLAWRKWLQAVGFSLFFAISFYLPKWLTPSKSEWLVFDVGQGLAMALIYAPEKAVVYDTGASWKSDDGTVSSMAKMELLPYLKRHGISVEAIFLSHDDNDHSGGVADLLQAFPKARLISASQQRYHDKAPEPCLVGAQWQFGEWQLAAVFPKQQGERAKNHDSCVILAKNDRLRLLFTGDAGVEQERQFAPSVGRVDFLQVGHHGSKTSTSETLLAQAQPSIAVISAGRWNPWKLPNPQTVERLARHKVTLFHTAEVGMVRVKMFASRTEIELGRGEFSPWYQQFY